MNDNQKKILSLFSANPKLTAKLIAEDIGISLRKVETNIANLKKMGLLERQGSDRKGLWLVKYK